MLNVALAGAILVLLVTGPAGADTLVTGAIRDRAGAPVRGARVTAFDLAGRFVGADVAGADGTFALAARTQPDAITIACDFCESQRFAVVAGEPIVAIVERYAAVIAGGPSADDIRALPYRRSSEVASLVPFTVVTADRIADRGLARYGVFSIDGLPFYNPANGSNAGGLLPAHALAALTVQTPLSAPAYGGYASAGTYDARTTGPDLGANRFDVGNASDAVARFAAPGAGATYAVSSDSGAQREALSAYAGVPLGGGRLSVDALGLAASGGHAAGGGLTFATDSRRFETSGSLSLTETNDSSLTSLGAQVRNRGPLGLEFGLRATRSTAPINGAAAVQSDTALYAAAKHETAAGLVTAAIAWDRGADSGIAQTVHRSALIGSIADDFALGAHWTAHLGAITNLRIPTFAEVLAVAPDIAAGDRSALFEQSLSYSDLRRLRLAASTYSERTTGAAAGNVAGIGVDIGWQIAPRLSLRSWLLLARPTSVSSGADTSRYPSLPPPSPALTRSLIWLTYERRIRVDALLRGGAIEADVHVPVLHDVAIALGTSVYNRRRYTTFGLIQKN